MSLSFFVSAWAVKEVQVKMAHKAIGIEDRRMKNESIREGSRFYQLKVEKQEARRLAGLRFSVKRIGNALLDLVNYY